MKVRLWLRLTVRAFAVSLLSLALVIGGPNFASEVYAIIPSDYNSIKNNTPFYDPTQLWCRGGSNSSSSSSSTLSGNDNFQKIFNFFVNNGFTPPQAAGIVGNVEAESHGDPLIWQGDGRDYQTPPDPNAQEGWGIVQWTPSSKIVNYATSVHQAPGDLGTQVAFLLAQLNGTAPNNSEKPAGDDLRTQTTAYNAAVSFLQFYERAADHSPTGPNAVQRGGFANQALALYGSSSSSSTGSSPNTSTSSNGSDPFSCSSATSGGTGCQGNTGQYAALVGPTASFEGVDQGIDFFPNNSSPSNLAGDGPYDICAPASGTIVMASEDEVSYDRTPCKAQVREKLDQTPTVPNSAQYIYFAECINISSNITVGAHVNAGDVIGQNPRNPGIEIGWAPAADGGWLCAPGIPTPCGTSMDNWIKGLSANLTAGGGSSSLGNVVFISQRDARWNGKNICASWGCGSVSSEGCWASSVAMIISTFTHKTVTPMQAENTATPAESFASNGLPTTYYGSVTPTDFGYVDSSGGVHLGAALQAVQSGALVLAHGSGGNPFYDTPSHYEVIRSVTSSGLVYVNDPWDLPDPSANNLPNKTVGNVNYNGGSQYNYAHSWQAWPIEDFLSHGLDLTVVRK